MQKTEQLEAMRHSLSHILAMAVVDMFPETKLGIGPTIENGFYYDFDLPRTLIPEDLPLLEEKMKKIIKEDEKFERQGLSITDAKKFLKSQPYKVELVNDLEKEGEKKVSFYKTGDFVDLCKGPHIESSAKVGAFHLSHISGAYWKGSEKNPMLQRIYGYAFETKEELEKFLKNIEEAKKRDHRKVGPELGLFMFHETAPGMPYWLPKGLTVLNQLIDFWREEHVKNGYFEIKSPLINKKELYEKSGHWEHYQEEMFISKTELSRESYLLLSVLQNKQK